MEELKQVIIVRKDLKMPKGKLAGQCSHASVEAVIHSRKTYVDEWRRSGAKKIVVSVENEETLMKCYEQAKKSGLVAVLIEDSGKTFFNEPTKTCVGIGPDDEKKINLITGKLKLVS